MIFGDCSATVMVDNRYWTIHPPSKNVSEPVYTNADYVHHLNPNAKIIAMLRNPVDRIYSEYMFFMHGSPEEFHDLVKKNILYTRECLKYNSLRYCFYKAPDNNTQAEIMLGWGVYFLHLKEFLRVFPRKQIFVIKLEDFSQNTVSYMRRIFSFLKIRQLPDDQLRQISSPEKRANERKKSDKEKGGMLVETRKILEDFYEPYNKLLVDLLGEQFDFNN
ncbi:carbohydrate sulfotransferase 15-like [Mercenaria mercenaria]|uniref:carbohydrate sulfotransferase 15-like n=1 Tax=Mercenaria mercenaria TaxID=6596 RepID=UPI00234E7341|nr:carbohydrate sulfotransferase 15-like [Mercenaria mercenaria]